MRTGGIANRGRTEDVGGPAGSKKAAKRCTEMIRTVGPTLKGRTFALHRVLTTLRH